MPKRKLVVEEKSQPLEEENEDAYADTDTEMDDQQEQQQSTLFRLSSRVKSMKRRGINHISELLSVYLII